MKQALSRAGRKAADLSTRLWLGVRRHPWLTAAAVPALCALYVAALIPFTPSIGDVRKAKEEKPTLVMTADGQELAVFKRANRDWVPLKDISPNVLAALIATEDRRFFQHHGFDFRRTAAALVHTAKGDTQGGSTLTQQLARNLYPEEIGRAPTITRKLKEAITAVKIEAVYSKQEILETYLNTVPFLYNAYGIEMAARTYFDKPADKLDVLEAATLVGMLKGTSYYNPVLNPERAAQRRNTVLAQMVRDGKLEAAQYDKLKTRPLKVDFERQIESLGDAPHFSQMLRRWLIEWADRNDYDIHADGLVVRTTIDSRLQKLATEAVVRQTDRLQGAASGAGRAMMPTFIRESAKYRELRESGVAEADALKQLSADKEFMAQLRAQKAELQAGFLAIDPRSGHVMAWVGSTDFAKDQFDHVQQARRQPGSTFKPFVYGAAFEQGIRPTDTFVDQVVDIQVDRNKFWRPGDVGTPTGQPMTLREGLMFSKNTITAQLMQNVGPVRVAQVARAMGVRQSKLDLVPSLALGTSPVTLKEMVSAYATIANGGDYLAPVLVTRIEDRNGRVLEEFQPPVPERGLALSASQQLIDAMRGVVDQGTARAIRASFGIEADVAGKTGTTQDYTDGWFILMHPQLVAGAWVGFNDNRVTMQESYGQGARSALPIVGDFFQRTLKTGVIDAKARFVVPEQAPAVTDPSLMGRAADWFNSWLPGSNTAAAQPAQEPQVVTIEAPASQQPQAQVPASSSWVYVPPPEQPAPAAMPYPRPPESPLTSQTSPAAGPGTAGVEVIVPRTQEMGSSAASASSVSGATAASRGGATASTGQAWNLSPASPSAGPQPRVITIPATGSSGGSGGSGSITVYSSGAPDSAGGSSSTSPAPSSSGGSSIGASASTGSSTSGSASSGAGGSGASPSNAGATLSSTGSAESAPASAAEPAPAQ
jgi:penicillin-binding protein 1A